MLTTWPDRQTPVRGPLGGVRVLDLSAFAVGPWAGALLCALGADVVKVEPPYGDHIRNVRPTKSGEPTTYSMCNLGKRSITLDLKDPSGRDAALELASQCDALVENTRAGAMDRLGLGFSDVAAVNPNVVYCSSSSFGDAGPMARQGSTDPQGQAFSGFVSVNGAEGDEPEFLRYSAAIDLSTSVYLAQACLLGLHWRARNGLGCHITTSQFEGALGVQITKSAEYLIAGEVPRPLGSSSTRIAPSAAFVCRDRRHLAVSAWTDEQWLGLCAAAGRGDLAADERYSSNASRLANRADLHRALDAAFAQKDLAWWRRQLLRHAVPHAEYAVLDDIVHGSSRLPVSDLVTRVPHPTAGSFAVGQVPWRFSRTPAKFDGPPTPSQHQDEFLVTNARAAVGGSSD